MIADYLPMTRRSLMEQTREPLTSRFAVFLEHCNDQPLVLPISSGEGKGFVGLVDSPSTKINLGLTASTAAAGGVINLEPDAHANLFSPINDNQHDGTVGYRFTFENIPLIGGEITLVCSEPVDVIVAHRDHSDFELEYEVTTTKIKSNSASDKAARGEIVLKNVQKAVRPLKAKAITKKVNGGNRLLKQTTDNVDIHDETESSVQFDYSNPGEFVLVQLEIQNPYSGGQIHRSILVKTELESLVEVSPLDLKSSFVDDEGDLNLIFSGIDFDRFEVVLLKTLITVEWNGKTLKNSRIELQGMTQNGHLILNGGWIRTILDQAAKKYGSCDVFDDKKECWKVVVAEGLALDPENMYRVIATLSSAKNPAIGKNKNLLSNAPTKEETEISDEMKRGRPPPDFRRLQEMHLRGLQSASQKKIMVHGYCTSSNPFPDSHFTNEVSFADPGYPTSRRERRLGGLSGGNNWSNDLFARKIIQYAVNNGITSCGIVAHSQGGLAALHLYTYYWSCLDYSSVSGCRMIQSVGSPYQGTALSSAADLGDIFGFGCGKNDDLTESGATSWLANIPTWARNKVYYWTTSFKDNWLSYDYCHLGTDLLLNDPDDGVVEQSRGQLSSGINRGHKVDWCHSSGMVKSPHYLDSSRNSEMNAYACY
ncbi:hypothetical protein ACA910_002770 [Epithemia clementina (nom. ined.)]